LNQAQTDAGNGSFNHIENLVAGDILQLKGGVDSGAGTVTYIVDFNVEKIS